MTIDDLAILIQREFVIMRKELLSKEEFDEALKKLATKEDVDLLKGRIDRLEEKTDNGFYAINVELKEIRALTKKIDTRKQVFELHDRMDVLEKKIGIG